MPGVIGSALGLVRPVSVYCDWVRWRVGSVTSISVWQDVELSEQICLRDTLACCWHAKQPSGVVDVVVVVSVVLVVAVSVTLFVCLVVGWLLNVPATG